MSASKPTREPRPSGDRLGNAARIARTEWRRHRRDRHGSATRRRLLAGVWLAAGIVLGVLGFAVGRELAAGSAGAGSTVAESTAPGPTVSIATAVGDWLWLVATVAVALLGWRAARATHERFERLQTAFLLTTVPTRIAALGLLGFVSLRVGVAIAIPTLGAAVGTAVGLRSPAVAPTVVVATAGLAAVAVTAGTAGRLAARLVGRRFVRARTLRDLLVLFGWVPLVVGFFVLREAWAGGARIPAWLELQPMAWFVDLALLGAGDAAGVEVPRVLAALAVVAVAVPLLAGATTVFARRLWDHEPGAEAPGRGSRSLAHDGWLELLSGSRVPRPAATVARRRWLGERRVPRGLLSTAYVLLFVSVVGLPAFALLGAPVLLLVVFGLGLSAGVAFGSDPVAVEYRSLDVLLTAVDGRQFVAGYVLAATTAALALVAVLLGPLWVAGVTTAFETAALALVGTSIAACTAAVATAIGLGVDRDALVALPAFFTDVPVYGEVGSAEFRRLGAVFALVSLALVPAVAGTLGPIVDVATTAGIPAPALRIGAMLATALLAAGLAVLAARTAVDRFLTYRLE